VPCKPAGISLPGGRRWDCRDLRRLGYPDALPANEIVGNPLPQNMDVGSPEREASLRSSAPKGGTHNRATIQSIRTKRPIESGYVDWHILIVDAYTILGTSIHARGVVPKINGSVSPRFPSGHR
jgi:hypothetical protein